MKPAQRFALIMGLTYSIIGLLGFISGLVSDPQSLPNVVADVGVISGFGTLLGFLPVNSALNLIHVVIGVVGLVVSISLDSARFYSGLTGILLISLAILGLIPVASSFFGLFPLYGGDIWLHGLFGAVAVFYGFIATPDLRDIYEEQLG